MPSDAAAGKGGDRSSVRRGLDERSGVCIPGLVSRLTVYSPRREERAHGQRPIAATGGDRAVEVRGGYSDGPGTWFRCQARPPSAWLKAEGRVWRKPVLFDRRELPETEEPGSR